VAQEVVTGDQEVVAGGHEVVTGDQEVVTGDQGVVLHPSKNLRGEITGNHGCTQLIAITDEKWR